MLIIIQYVLQFLPAKKICTTILKLYNENELVADPAVADQIKGKTVVCIVSGSNNDIDRMQEIKERSLQYEGLKHYFLIRFAHGRGASKEFVNNILSRMMNYKI